MEVRLDRDVYTSEGERVGTVNEIVIHPETMQIEAFLVREGLLFSHDRIIEPEFIDYVDDEGNVHLNITRDREDDLPTYAEREYVRPDRDTYAQMEAMPWYGGAGGRLLIPATSQRNPDYPAPESPMQAAPLEPDPMEVESNLPEDTVTVSEGTDVIDSTGAKLGTVDEIVYDEDGSIAAFVIRQGVIFRTHIRIPIDWVEAVTHDYIRINRTGREAEAAGTMD